MLVDCSCERCGSPLDNTVHVLRNCMAAKRVWNNIIPVSSHPWFYSLDLKDWICMNLWKEGQMVSGINWCIFFGVAIWRLWYWRNQFIFQQQAMDSASIIQDINIREKEIQKLNTSSLAVRSRKIKRWIQWKQPLCPWCKLNTDGARKQLGASSAGGLIRNHLGMWLTGFGLKIGFCSVTAAELWGFYQGLLLTWQHGIQFLHVEVDSCSPCKQIDGGDQRVHPSKPLH